MNETLSLLHTHRSHRSFTAEPVAPETLKAIVEAAYHGPTSMNGQQISLVVVQDAAKRARIAELAGGQKHIAQAPVFIAVIVDFYKTHLAAVQAGAKQELHESVEGLLVGAVDAGIALGNLLVAGRAAGLGVVPIGGIRRDPQAIIDLLRLPRLTFPVVGMSMGHIAKDVPVKPRLPIQSFWHAEVYDAASLDGAMHTYDAQLVEYWQQLKRPDGGSWSATIAAYYGKVYYPQVKAALLQQGFLLDK